MQVIVPIPDDDPQHQFGERAAGVRLHKDAPGSGRLYRAAGLKQRAQCAELYSSLLDGLARDLGLGDGCDGSARSY